MEKWLLAENHGCEHGTKRPQVEGIVVFLVVHKQFGTLEVPRSYTDIVLSSGVVELSQTPINQPQLSQRHQRTSYIRHRHVRAIPFASRDQS